MFPKICPLRFDVAWLSLSRSSEWVICDFPGLDARRSDSYNAMNGQFTFSRSKARWNVSALAHDWPAPLERGGLISVPMFMLRLVRDWCQSYRVVPRQPPKPNVTHRSMSLTFNSWALNEREVSLTNDHRYAWAKAAAGVLLYLHRPKGTHGHFAQTWWCSAGEMWLGCATWRQRNRHARDWRPSHSRPVRTGSQRKSND